MYAIHEASPKAMTYQISEVYDDGNRTEFKASNGR